jgi:4-hydroxy 2-oxovalerate aldolase
MGKKFLLDCTLRDGGYVNDWEFGQDNLISIFERLTDANVDIVEVGFLDERRPFDINRSIMPNTESVERILGNVKKRPQMVVGMIDFGTCSLKNIQPCSESFLDGIRVIFKKQKMYEAMAFCAELKKLGYKVFSQLVSITAYSDDDLKELIKLVNDVEPYAVSMVDTYGLLNPVSLLHYYEILDEYVKPNIGIGFHAHNNFQLGYANAVTFLSKQTDRDIVVDGTLFGMGKSAGNDPLELVAMYMNEHFDTEYDIRQMLESIEESVNYFYSKSPWGYKVFFYLSSSNKCHPSYVEYFQKKDCLSVSKLDELLSKIEPEDKKLLYDKDLAEKLFNEYISKELNDAESFSKLGCELANRKILILGPGMNIALQKSLIEDFIAEHKPLIISINYIPSNFDVNYVFTTKNNRYKEMAKDLLLSDIRVISTSNITSRSKNFDYVFNRLPLLELKEDVKDNSFIMLLKVLKSSGIKSVFCAGFDGYSDTEGNYVSPSMEYDFVKNKAHYLNSHIKDVLSSLKNDMDINFITYSKYDVVEDIENGAF